MELFPSRTITLYLARLFITRILGVLIMLVLVLQTLDLLSESGTILAHQGNGEAQIWQYVGLRMPQLVARFLPYSVLLATLFTFFPLNQNSEIIAMRAAGLSALQILAPLLITAVGVSAFSFLFNETVVTGSTATLKAWQGVNYGRIEQASGVRSNVYIADGRNILYAETLTGSGAGAHMQDVTWYERDDKGMITRRIESPSASYAAPGWRFDHPQSFDAATTALTELAAPVVVGRGITPRQVDISAVDADGLNIFQLARAIRALHASGRRTAELDGKWWHKVSSPLSAMLMPLLGGVAAFGLARSGQLFVRAVAGMALGFAYFVIDNLALAVGNFGGYPPIIAAWAPFLLFLLVGETVLIRTEE
ncbi:MAG TPA: LPS export ABC transporter permease LptG [Novosphingobium sp.]|nr:LPS export ABC transporter permease LptG [Novosphingobium sp.]